MNSYRAGRFFGSAALLAAGLWAGPAAAQTNNVQYPPGAVVQPLESVAASRLADFVKALAIDPRNLASLLGAGNAALELGDTAAALTFFARAEEVAPRDGRVKAGMGSAFVQTEQPHAALQFFAEAVALGAPMSMIAKDRGLAYDMIGDTTRAQADYEAALRFGIDPEVERRLALSRAIGGDKAGALSALERQLRQNDPAVRRTHTFVLALTGDTEGAMRAVQAAMPAQSVAIRPFLTQLPNLASAEKAMAVHFGRFPAGGRFAASAPAASPLLDAGRPDPRQPALGQPNARTAEAQPARERRPSNFEVAGRRAPSAQTTRRPASVPTPAAELQRPAPEPLQTARLEPSRPAAQPYVAPEAIPAAEPDSTAAPGLNFADVAAVVASLPDAPAARAAPTPPAAKPKAPAKTPEKKAEPAKPTEPARIWVQIAASQNKAGFPAEFRRLKGKTKALEGKTAWTAPFRATNRLLVGPFKTDKEARDLVNELSKADIDSFSWKSEAGQAIEKLGQK